MVKQTSTDIATSIPFSAQPVRTLAVYCSDGRFIDQTERFLGMLGAERADRVVVPGGSACLSDHSGRCDASFAIWEQVRFLIDAHQITRVILIAHDDCGYYAHKRHMRGEGQCGQQHFDMEAVARQLRQFKAGLRIEVYRACLDEGKVSFEAMSLSECDRADQKTAG